VNWTPEKDKGKRKKEKVGVALVAIHAPSKDKIKDKVGVALVAIHIPKQDNK